MMLKSVLAAAFLVSCAVAQSNTNISDFLDSKYPASQAQMHGPDPGTTLGSNFSFAFTQNLTNVRLPPFGNVRYEEVGCVPQRIVLSGIQATREAALKLIITVVNGRVMEYDFAPGLNGNGVSFEWNPAGFLVAGDLFALHMIGSGSLYGNDAKRPTGDSSFYKAVGSCKTTGGGLYDNSDSEDPLTFYAAGLDTSAYPIGNSFGFWVAGGSYPFTAVIQYPGQDRRYNIPIGNITSVAHAIIFNQSDAYIFNIRDAKGSNAIPRLVGGLPLKSSASSAIRSTAGFLSVVLAGAIVLVW